MFGQKAIKYRLRIGNETDRVGAKNANNAKRRQYPSFFDNAMRQPLLSYRAQARLGGIS